MVSYQIDFRFITGVQRLWKYNKLLVGISIFGKTHMYLFDANKMINDKQGKLVKDSSVKNHFELYEVKQAAQ